MAPAPRVRDGWPRASLVRLVGLGLLLLGCEACPPTASAPPATAASASVAAPPSAPVAAADVVPPVTARPLAPQCAQALQRLAAAGGPLLLEAAPASSPRSLLLLDGGWREPVAPERLARLAGGVPDLLAAGPLPAPVRERLRQLSWRLAASAPVDPGPRPLVVDYPAAGALFPPGSVPPLVRWHDPAPEAEVWLVEVVLAAGAAQLVLLGAGNLPEPQLDPGSVTGTNVLPPTVEEQATRGLRPEPLVWEVIQQCATEGPARLRVSGFAVQEPDRLLSRGETALGTAPDPVDGAIFFRDVPLPFRHALKNMGLIRWRLGDVTSPAPPRTLLTNLPVCANCHSFDRQGTTLALDVDYANDKGSYAIVPVAPEMTLEPSRIIAWSEYRQQDRTPTFGLLSQISPDGRYVVSTVKDLSVFVAVPDLHYSQLFFPIKGILVVYDRQTRRFFPLPGADDPAFVQSNPVWSPDGEAIVFARAPAFDIGRPRDSHSAVLDRQNLREFVEQGKELQYDSFSRLVDGKTPFRYDLYRIPFAGGRGGTPEPIPGASANGRSNFFPRFSPDGRFLVFCQSASYMLLQPDSELFLLPAAGGTPRKLRANHPGRMNSWHSWSPNGRWLVYSSKANGPYTQLWLAHVDAQGNDAPPVLLEHFTLANRAANIPEFVPFDAARIQRIDEAFSNYYNHLRQGYQYFRLDEYGLAEAQLRQALALKEADGETHQLLAEVLQRQGLLLLAVPHLRRALALDATRVDLTQRLGELLLALGEEAEARQRLSQSLARQGEPSDGTLPLIWLLASSARPEVRDEARALALARRLCQRHGPTPARQDAQAAALAALGRFPEAVALLRETLATLPPAEAGMAPELRQRLLLYERGQPYRRPLRRSPSSAAGGGAENRLP